MKVAQRDLCRQTGSTAPRRLRRAGRPAGQRPDRDLRSGQEHRDPGRHQAERRRLNFRPVVAPPWLPRTERRPRPLPHGHGVRHVLRASPSPAPQASSSTATDASVIRREALPPATGQRGSRAKALPAKSARQSSSSGWPARCADVAGRHGLRHRFDCFGKGLPLPTSEAEFQKLSARGSGRSADPGAANIYDCKTPVVDNPHRGVVASRRRTGTAKYLPRIGSDRRRRAGLTAPLAQPRRAPSRGRLEMDRPAQPAERRPDDVGESDTRRRAVRRPSPRTSPALRAETRRRALSSSRSPWTTQR